MTALARRQGLLAQQSGHVVNIIASLVDQPLASLPAGLAALTKGGLNALTKSLAIEVAKRGVRVNAVAPGIIKTPMHAPATHDSLAELMPVGRIGEVQDIVDAVLYHVREAVAAGLAEIVLDDFTLEPILVHAVWPSGSRMTSLVRRFVDLLAQRLKKEVV